MFKISKENIILRDMVESDIENYVRWFTTETEFMNWDAPWEENTTTVDDERKAWTEYYHYVKNLPSDKIRTNLQIEVDGIHIGWVSAYDDLDYLDNKEGYLAIGIDIPPVDYRKKGYGTKALKMFMDYLFENGHHTFYTQTWSGNDSMIVLSKKLGFEEYYRVKDFREVNGRKYDAVTFKWDFLERYLHNPCRTLSIPYWKNKSISIPENIDIVHKDDFHGQYSYYETYFRMYHSLKKLEKPQVLVQTIDLNKDLDELTQMMNESYQDEDIFVTKEDILSWTKRNVFRPDLWVKIVVDNKIIASGIAEYDEECKEGILEWIQVLPQYHHQSYGKAICLELLNRLKSYANFVTVSGRTDNKCHPDNLYRSCGFTGDDIWYICI